MDLVLSCWSWPIFVGRRMSLRSPWYVSLHPVKVSLHPVKVSLHPVKDLGTLWIIALFTRTGRQLEVVA